MTTVRSTFTAPTAGTYHFGYGEPHLEGDCPEVCMVGACDGRVTAVEFTSDPVGAPAYPGALPPDDQDAADARCPAGPGSRVPAQAVRLADETGDHDAAH